MKRMKVSDLLKELEAVCLTGQPDREIACGYCGDLLSRVMANAPSDCAWVTVMGNVNAVAVASLTDAACVILAEGAPLDEEARARAEQHGICIVATKRPMYEVCSILCRKGIA